MRSIDWMLCECGCYLAEHEHRITEQYQSVPQRCLTCDDCEGFRPKGEHVGIHQRKRVD